jgi:hypothetical protein
MATSEHEIADAAIRSDALSAPNGFDDDGVSARTLIDGVFYGDHTNDGNDFQRVFRSGEHTTMWRHDGMQVASTVTLGDGGVAFAARREDVGGDDDANRDVDGNKGDHGNARQRTEAVDEKGVEGAAAGVHDAAVDEASTTDDAAVCGDRGGSVDANDVECGCCRMEVRKFGGDYVVHSETTNPSLASSAREGNSFIPTHKTLAPSTATAMTNCVEDYNDGYDGYNVTATRLRLRLQFQLEVEEHARGHQPETQKQKGKWHRNSRG